MKVITAHQHAQRKPHLNVMVYGQPGAGKTMWASGSPMPLVIQTEPQGLASVFASNPDAHALIPDTWVDYVQVAQMLKAATQVTLDNGQVANQVNINGEEIQFQTLVLDSFTDLQVKCIQALSGQTGAKAMDIKSTAQMSIQQWGKLSDVMAQVLRDLRALPCNVVVICLADERYDNEDRRRVVPLLAGRKMPSTVGQYFNAVGYLTTDRNEVPVTVWSPSGRFISKPAPGFPAITSTRECSLGSLLLHTYKMESVAHLPGDSPDTVTAYINKDASDASDTASTEPKTQSRRRGRTRS